MWVQLTVAKVIERGGQHVTYHPGDWIDVGRQQALEWIADTAARSVDPSTLELFTEGTGIYTRGDPARILRYLGPYAKSSLITDEPPVVHFPKTCILKPVLDHVPRLDVFPSAWALLDRWEAVVPLLSYDRLAAEFGTPGEREITLAIVHDLRIPLYDPSTIFVRQCPAGEALMDAFAEERRRGDDEPLAFLRAVYAVKPLILAVPRTWSDRNAHRTEKW